MTVPDSGPRIGMSENYHEWLKKFGRDKVHDQIEGVITIMKLCNNMDDFREKFARVFKRVRHNCRYSTLIFSE
jgi:hypothetical protein